MENILTYKVISKFDFYLNDKILNFIYTHIIGYDAVLLYRFLYNEYQYDLIMGNTKKTQNRIIQCLDWDYNKYISAKNILEAIGLISTYLDNSKNDHIIFYLNQIPTWDEFKNNNKLMSLLRNNVDIVEFDRIKYLFEGNDILNNYSNISCTFESIYNNDDIIKMITFDFKKLYDTIFKLYKKLISISTSAKAMIESYYKTNSLTFNEILNIVLHSIYKDQDGIVVDEKILKMNFEKMVNTAKVISINNVINVNRNHKIFMKDISDENFEYVIADYKTINSEQYISSISKTPIDLLNKNLIEILRSQYNLPDFIINILVDYSVFKNAGRIEPNYIQKIAMSINRLNINSVEKILEHLRNSNIVHKGV